MKQSAKNSKYAFGTYKPNKNAVPVTYKGTQYLSKAQCMALEGITRKELDAYLAGGNVEEETPATEESNETFEESLIADFETTAEAELDPEDIIELEDEKEDEEDLPF